MPEIARDVLAVMAAALITAGCWWIYPPAGLIALGAIVLAGLCLGLRG